MYNQSNVITCLKCKAKFILFSINCTYVCKELKPFENEQ